MKCALEDIAYTLDFLGLCDIVIHVLTKKLIMSLNIAWVNNFKFFCNTLILFLPSLFLVIVGSVGKTTRGVSAMR